MIRAVLFDRDGTLIADEPGFRFMPGAQAAIARLRAAGIRIGVVTNQPGAGESAGAFDRMQRVHERIEACLGKLDGWFVCTHAPEQGCVCGKPQPALIQQAALHFGIAPHECVVIGDIGSDVEAAQRAGAQAILVPTPVTRACEVERAPQVCRDLHEAVDRIIGQVAA